MSILAIPREAIQVLSRNCDHGNAKRPLNYNNDRGPNWIFLVIHVRLHLPIPAHSPDIPIALPTLHLHPPVLNPHPNLPLATVTATTPNRDHPPHCMLTPSSNTKAPPNTHRSVAVIPALSRNTKNARPPHRHTISDRQRSPSLCGLRNQRGG